MRKIFFPISILYVIASSGQTTISFKTKKNDNVSFEVSQKNIYIGNTDSSAKLNKEKVITSGKDFKIIETIEKQYDDKLKKIKTENTIVEPVLIYKDGTKQICRSEIIIKINPNESLEVILKEIDFSASKNDFVADQYLVKIKNYDTTKVFELINSLTNDKRIDFVEPNFLRLNISQTADPYYSSQWSINNAGYLGGIVDADMDVDDAWSYSTGAGIKVAIIDEGVDLTHPDLSTNLLVGFDATDSNSQGAYSNNDSHGTSCAGIVAAVANNNIGTTGIAYNSMVIPVKVAYKNNTGDWNTNDNWLANGINWAWQNGADILSNSWGGGSPSTSITNAINNAVTNGRSGKGCVVLFSSGNHNTSVSFPASLSNVIAVGASNTFDERKSEQSAYHDECWYNDCHGGSNYGTNLDIVAPGVKISTSYIQGGYTSTFNGTSAACPNAAGVMALILSLKPSLTNTEARQILENSTDKVTGYTYASGVSGQSNGTWNNEVGYGRINALKAVKLAYPYSIYGSNSICSGAQGFVGITPTPPAESVITWQVPGNLTTLGTTPPNNTPNSSYLFLKRNPSSPSGYDEANVSVSINGNLLPDKYIRLGEKPFSYHVQKSTSYSEYCDYTYHYLSLDVINTDVTGSYTYTFSNLTAGMSNSGITFTQTDYNKFLFKIPLNKIPSGANPAVFIYTVAASGSCTQTPHIQYGQAIVLNSCNSSGLTSQSKLSSSSTTSIL